MDNEDIPKEYYLTVKFLMSTGSLMTAMGMGYVSLPIDVIPDIIPIFGSMDDFIAKMIAGAGIMMMYMGYRFGSGETPQSFQIVVTVVSTIYNIVVPFFKETVAPILMPILEAIAVPMKVAASKMLGVAMEQARSAGRAAAAADMSSGAGGDL